MRLYVNTLLLKFIKHFLVFRYGETLLDVLFVGGIISAGGAIEGNIRTNVSKHYCSSTILITDTDCII